jgi:hypothetical protein
MAVLTLWGQGTGGVGPAANSDPGAYTLGITWKWTSSGSDTATATGVWFFSGTGAATLPGTIALYDYAGGGLIHSEAASWKTGPGGSAASPGGATWVYAAFASPPSLTSAKYYITCVLNAATGGNPWYTSYSNFWVAPGPGQNGLANGELNAPNNSTAGGQDRFNSGTALTYPASSFNSTNYWIDPEITTSPGGATVTGSAALSSPGILVAAARDVVRAAVPLTAGASLAASGHAIVLAAPHLGALPILAAAASAIPAAAPAAPVLSDADLWAAYLAAAYAAAAAREAWAQARQAGGSLNDGQFYGSAYEAEQAADTAYAAWLQAHRQAFPGARG